jgi:hypothetical protein
MAVVTTIKHGISGENQIASRGQGWPKGKTGLAHTGTTRLETPEGEANRGAVHATDRVLVVKHVVRTSGRRPVVPDDGNDMA